MQGRRRDPAATAFAWDIYLFGAEAGADSGIVNLSGLTADNDFSARTAWGSARAPVCAGSRPTTAPTPTSPTA